MQKITHLIPLSEFVNHIDKQPIDDETALFYIKVYNNFLQQPLELWQFVPIGDNNEVLEEPKHYKEWVAYTNDGWEPEYDAKVMENYNKAKERCLFEGFEWNKNEYAQSKYLSIDEELMQDWKKIEKLVEFKLPLTQSALKQIY